MEEEADALTMHSTAVLSLLLPLAVTDNDKLKLATVTCGSSSLIAVQWNPIRSGRLAAAAAHSEANRSAAQRRISRHVVTADRKHESQHSDQQRQAKRKSELD